MRKSTHFARILACSLVALLVSAATVWAQKPKDYAAAEVYTYQSYQYGKIEFRMRTAVGSGTLSNFFTWKEGSELNNVFWEEVDIEVLGKNNAETWQSNIISGSGTRVTSEQYHSYPFSFADDYHTFTLEWTPGEMVWYVDGVETRRTTGGQASDIANPAQFRFNIWAANIEEWVGPFDDSILPIYMYVNYIKYYRYENGAFVLDWTDDFDSLDLNRWGLADWTFSENLAQFDPSNVVISNGKLVLGLTPKNATGYAGTAPDDPIDGGCTDCGSNQAPTAQLSASATSGEAPLAVSFDGGGSTDPDGDALTYFWDFGDGTSASGVTASHTYTSLGTFTARLTVSDGKGGTSVATQSITVNSASGTGNCLFGAPQAEPLAGTGRTIYKYLYTFGQGGPDVSTWNELGFNWNDRRNQFSQFSLSTTTEYIDLKPYTTHSLNQAEPGLTVSGSPIAGLDGAYWVTLDGDNLVLVSQTGAYTLYCSKSATPPACPSARGSAPLAPAVLGAMQLYPNPSQTDFTLRWSADHPAQAIRIMDQLGRTVLQQDLRPGTTQWRGGQALPPGLYAVSLLGAQGIQTLPFLKQ